MKTISVIIVTYNSENYINDCLNSLYQYNDIGDELEIIIVDNCSDNADNFLLNINLKYPTIKTIKNINNGGYGQGNNIGIKVAEAPIIMIMNPDVRLVMPVFQYVKTTFNTSLITMLGIMQCDNAGRKVYSYKWDALSSSIFTNIITKLFNTINLFLPSTMYIEGACFFIRKENFVKIGLFDENIFLYGEETDIKRRIVNCFGTRAIKYNPRLKYMHLVTGRNLSVNNFIREINSKIYLCDKFHYSKMKFIRHTYYTCMLLYYRSIITNSKKNIHYFQKCIEMIKSISTGKY